MDQIDLSVLAGSLPAESSPLALPPPAAPPLAVPRDGSPGDASSGASAADAGDGAAEAERRTRRAAKRGRRIRDALGATAKKYVIDLGEYKRKKVKVFAQYEGFALGAAERKARELRVAMTLPDKWVDAPTYKLKAAFVATYNARHPKQPLAEADCALAVHDESYLTFSKTMVSDAAIIGDALHENEEVFVVTEADVAHLDAEVEKLRKVIHDYEEETNVHATIDARDVVDMSTVSREIDPYRLHVLLVGLGQVYMLPVEGTYTVADIKYFIHFKGGPDRFPLGSLDVALVENFEINILGDHLTMEQLARRVYGDGCTLVDEGTSTEPRRKVAVPLYWGKRLIDPKYFIWIPSLHTPDSFKGPDDGAVHTTAPAVLATQAAASNSSPPPQAAGGECAIS